MFSSYIWAKKWPYATWPFSKNIVGWSKFFIGRRACTEPAEVANIPDDLDDFILHFRFLRARVETQDFASLHNTS